MAVFAPKTTAKQSEDGLQTIFTDVSNYTTNDQGYLKSQFTTNDIVIKDAYGTVLASLNFLSGNTVTLSQQKDTWFRVERLLAGVAGYTTVEKFPLKQITMNKLADVIDEGCCMNEIDAGNLCKSQAMIQSADFAELSGNSVAWQKDIDAANKIFDVILQ